MSGENDDGGGRTPARVHYSDHVKPFLLLATRADDAAADNEYASFLAFSGLAERELRRLRLEQRALGDMDPRDWSGMLLGGGPFNCTEPEPLKSPVQRRVEADLYGLLDRVIAADFPFLGACYGIGMIGSHQRAVVDRRYAEPVGYVSVTLTAQGRADPLLRELPGRFDAFVGHKEAISGCPATPCCWPVRRLPGAGVPGRRERLRHPVPPRTRRGRLVHQDRRLQARRLLRAGAGGRAQGTRPAQRCHPPARDLAPVRPALRAQRPGQSRARAGQSESGPARTEPGPASPEPGPHAAVPAAR